MTPAEQTVDGSALQRAYRRDRLAWAREIGRPIPRRKADKDEITPPPGELDAEPDE